MHTFLSILVSLEAHFDHILMTIIGLWLGILAIRGHSAELFAFLKEMMSDDVTKTASTKRFGYVMGVGVLSWGHVQLVRATCARITSGDYNPTTILVTSLAILATLVGAGYLFGKFIGSSLKTSGLTPDGGDQPGGGS